MEQTREIDHTRIDEASGEYNRHRTRRGFLTVLGAGGLSAAAMIFGHAKDAAAYCYVQCCHLVYCPNISWYECQNYGEYIWYCQSGYTTCGCCEWYAGNASAAQCS